MAATKVKCPVCDWEIKDPRKLSVGGKTVTVCSDECAAKVRANPSKYVKKA